ncbi:MAG: hypothetical protein FD143_2810 [Ignavibacteria bacterium]|nr:MAG: hypothetical protein FD143_2810 [Ignavibacteria bacterium]KAF0160182.1 MAG: hypothetical protein FD188_1996 [Ignavibacteria bacterium]
MKNVKSILVILFLFAATSAHAMLWELGVKVVNQNNSYIQRYVEVYYYNSSYKTYTFIGSYMSGTVDQDGYNALFNISGVSGDDPRALDTIK